ncbi:MAG: glutamyl-tRNA amidotransferase [Rickettsiales bacterium]|nr:glutamyl-tRNA amidotransferase [Rickettsiales bacterium]|tara:strand:- start:1639 stop:2100 length:462 start_codon:yes stop_codon:yes gene_type:complete
MVSFRENLKKSLDASLKNRDEIATSTLRLILAAVKDHDIQFRTKKKGEYISDQEILTILQNMVKQRKESVSIYSKAGRQDLKKREEKEIEIINSFLPTQIKSNDLEKIIEETIKELDCQSLKDLGKVISNLKEKYPAQMDMREVADLAKKKLK